MPIMHVYEICFCWLYSFFVASRSQSLQELASCGPSNALLSHTPMANCNFNNTSLINQKPSQGTQTCHDTPGNSYLQQYVGHLKEFYNCKSTPVYDKERRIIQTKAASFISITLLHKKTALAQVQTFDDYIKESNRHATRSVLVEGGPGIGKTTFALELCKRWAKGEALQDWAVILVMKLRDLPTTSTQTLEYLLSHNIPSTALHEVKQAVVKELIDRDGEGLLLILDGYDELTDIHVESGLVMQLMRRELLCKATLMVTSRSHATGTLHDDFLQSVDQHIQLLGFQEENLEEYVKSACGGDKPKLFEDFKLYLSSYPFLSSLMLSPLLCAIATDIYCYHCREHACKRFAPVTLTELYTGIVHIMLLRYLTHHPKHGCIWKIKDLNNLPQEVKQQLKAVTELAAEDVKNQATSNNCCVFDEDNQNIPPETLGLMEREEKVIPGFGISASYSFLHQTIQFYLAAVKYSQQCSTPEQLSELLSQNGLLSLHRLKRPFTPIYIVVQFLAGRTKLSGVSSDLLKAVGLHDDKDDDEATEVNILLLHLLYETQCPLLIQSTLVTMASRKYLSVTGRSPLDWYVIGYCIANSASTWRLNKIAEDKPNSFDQLVTILSLTHPNSMTGKIRCLHISGDWYENCKILSKLQPTYTETLTRLEMVHVDVHLQNSKLTEKESEDTVSISACSYPKLEELKIINSRSDFSPFLGICLNPIANCLHTILLNNCTLSSEVTQSLIGSLQSSNCRVCKLVLHMLTFSPDAKYDCLTIAIVKSTTIKQLLFTNLNALSFEELTSGLKQNRTMEELAVGSTLIKNFKDHLLNLITAVNSSCVKKLWLSNSYKEQFCNSNLPDSDVNIVWFVDKDELLKCWGSQEMRSVF